VRAHLLLTGAAMKPALEGRRGMVTRCMKIRTRGVRAVDTRFAVVGRIQRTAPGERDWPASTGACLGRSWLHCSTCAVRGHFLRDNGAGPYREVFDDPAHCRHTIKAVLAMAMDPHADPSNMRRETISTPALKQCTRSPSGSKLSRQGAAGKVVFDHMPEGDDRL
jgi:hypothetical protein